MGQGVKDVNWTEYHSYDTVSRTIGTGFFHNFHITVYSVHVHMYSAETESHFYFMTNQIIAWVYETVAAHPDLASTQVIGQTTEGRDLVLLKISTGGSGKPAIFIDGTMHAREWISPAVVS